MHKLHLYCGCPIHAVLSHEWAIAQKARSVFFSEPLKSINGRVAHVRPYPHNRVPHLRGGFIVAKVGSSSRRRNPKYLNSPAAPPCPLSANHPLPSRWIPSRGRHV